MTPASAVVIFDKVTAGKPGRAYFHKLASRPDGQQRALSMAPEVRDAELLKQVQALQPGDEVKITITTDWDQADLPSWLTAVEAVPETAAAA